jgi:hypothetical protein
MTDMKPFNYEELRKKLDAAPSREERYRLTLEAISKGLGRVCDEYETCTHPACADSCMAVLISLEALRS